VAIITAKAKVNAEDARKILEIVKSHGDDYGALAYYDRGAIKTYGNHSLEDLQSVGEYFGSEEMTPSAEAVVVGAVFGKKFLKTIGKKVAVDTKLTRTTWKTRNAETQSTKKGESSVLDTKMVIVLSPAEASMVGKIDPILEKYDN
jgi:hypothetical protein